MKAYKKERYKKDLQVSKSFPLTFVCYICTVSHRQICATVYKVILLNGEGHFKAEGMLTNSDKKQQ